MLEKEPKISQLIIKQKILKSEIKEVELALKQQKKKKVKDFNLITFNHKIFSERIKKLRKDLGYTQGEIALIIGKTRTSFTNYELYKIEPPVSVLFKLAQVFNTSIDYLLGLKDK